ncbi:hypothetical protein [Kangiella marina]|uniref:DUF3558 domain-containing protein n=1 Tax=Kangiella marina TaxID=1079178 RepID=A0ABP8IJJ5_9GAMM
MNRVSQLPYKCTGSSSALMAFIFAALIVIGGVVYFVKGSDNESPSAQQTTPPKTTTAPQATQQSKAQSPKPEPVTSIDPDTFCERIAAVGDIFGTELTGATSRERVSFGPQVGCSWSGPSVLVFFGDDSYERRNTGFGAENLVAYEETDLEAVKKDKYAIRSGFEIEVKSDKGLAFRVSQGTGRQINLTAEEYNQIANIVNNVLNEYY